MDRLTTAPADKISAPDFLRRMTGKPARSAVEIAEADARAARIRLAELIHRAEYATARIQREKIIREGMREGETYEEFRQRLNEPFGKAADRVNARLAEIELRRAA